ncbi:FRG domain-containing protein [Lacisediminihabitans sp. H27-G8]|uniref:FRG domain-containing protein n=1 Tax=Lacisediminihabitans sp. H27-G8 TaxID=3111909 RepID=UPI0038FBEFAA
MSVMGFIGVHSIGQRFAWRGMSSVDHRLISAAHRRLGDRLDETAVREAELKLLNEARRWGLGVGDTAYVDDLQLLADLQHYGVETRLIDFTSNPTTALWFACQTPGVGPHGRNFSKSGVLLALNVTAWPSYASVGPANTWDHISDRAGATLRHALNSQAPFLVESSHPNDRLRAQEGLFVASSVPAKSSFSRLLTTPFHSIDVKFSQGDPEKLGRQLTGDRLRGAPQHIPFVAVIINAGLKPKLLKYLENTYNRSPRVLFPDFAGYREFAAYGGLGGNAGAVGGRT